MDVRSITLAVFAVLFAGAIALLVLVARRSRPWAFVVAVSFLLGALGAAFAMSTGEWSVVPRPIQLAASPVQLFEPLLGDDDPITLIGLVLALFWVEATAIAFVVTAIAYRLGSKALRRPSFDEGLSDQGHR